MRANDREIITARGKDDSIVFDIVARFYCFSLFRCQSRLQNVEL